MTSIVSVISLVVPYLFLRMYTKIEKTEEKEVKEKPSISFIYVLMGIPLITGIQIITSIILSKINVNYDVVDKLNLFDGSSVLSKILFFIQIAILPAIFEELYMRKGIVSYLKKYGKTFACITSTLIFACLHLNLSQSIFAFMLGLVFAYIVTKTNRIFPTMILHFVNNGLSALTLIFEDNLIVLGIIGFLYLILNALGLSFIVIALIYKIKRRRKEKMNEEKTNTEKNNILKIYRYMLTDYTFILAIITIIVLSIYSEKILTII